MAGCLGIVMQCSRVKSDCIIKWGTKSRTVATRNLMTESRYFTTLPTTFLTLLYSMSQPEQSHTTDISMATETQADPEVVEHPKATVPSIEIPPQPDAPLSNLKPNEIKVFSAPVTASSTTASGSTSNPQTPGMSIPDHLISRNADNSLYSRY
jgi:hypothetical protein